MTSSILFDRSSQLIPQINGASRDRDVSSQRIASGYRINSAADDAAGLAIVTRLSSQISGLAMARRNTSEASSFLQVGDMALGSMTENLQRMRELSVQAANGTLGQAGRDAIQMELDMISEEVFRISDSTQFNGNSVLNNATSLSFQVGDQVGQQITVAAGDASSALTALSLGDLDVGSSTSAETAVGSIDDMLSMLNTRRAEFGAIQSRLDSVSSNLESQSINSSAARSEIRDADIASEAVDLVRADVRRRAGILLLAQANSDAASVLWLLR